MNSDDTRKGSLWERIVAAVCAFAVLGLVAYVVIRNERFADPNIVLLLRIFVSIASGIFGATIPGFLDVHWSGAGLAIRATGAFGFAIVTFFGSPYVIQTAPPPPTVTIDQPTGAANGANLELSIPFEAHGLQESMTLEVVVKAVDTGNVLRTLKISKSNWDLPSVSLQVDGAAHLRIIVQMVALDVGNNEVASSRAVEFSLDE